MPWYKPVVSPNPTVFVVAKSDAAKQNKHLAQEQEYHQDIIQLDHMDLYKNLTLKSLMALKWVTKYCSQAQYVLKTDDDTFNNIPATVDFLLAGGLHNNMIGGQCFTIPTNRNERSRFYVSPGTYPYTQLPVFCSGPAYILPQTVIPSLLKFSQNVTMYPHEDAFVTGIVRVLAGVSYTQVPGACVPYWKVRTGSCDLFKMTSVHNVNNQTQMETLWNMTIDNAILTNCKHHDHMRLLLTIIVGFVLPMALLTIYINLTNRYKFLRV